MLREVVIVGAARTPIGSFQGALSLISAPQLGAIAIKGALQRAGIAGANVDEVIMGQVITAGAKQAPARQASLQAEIPSSVPCTTINKVCGSGLKAVMLARQSILLNEAHVVVAGGMESMTQAPFLLQGARQGYRMGNQIMHDSMLLDGLMNPYDNNLMGIFGDTCAQEYAFTRNDQDNYAMQSYEYARKAQAEGLFREEIEPVSVAIKGQSTSIVDDEEPKNFKPEKMPMLKAAFSEKGTVTAANASKVSDGAAALVLMDAQQARQERRSVLATIKSTATFSQEPEKFTTAPIEAIRRAAAAANVNVGDIDLFEINEAFSVVTMAAIKELRLKREQVNIFGGAVSLGHPIGCSGARIVVTLLSAMKHTQARLGCAAICLGGGEAVAMIVER